MAQVKYLNSSGVEYLWGKIKDRLDTKVTAVSGKGLSTNDYTTAEKTKLEGLSAEGSSTIPIADTDYDNQQVDAILSVGGEKIKISFERNYTEERTTGTLDSIAYENLTYRDIFETQNELGISAGFDNGSYAPLVVASGSNIQLTQEDFDTTGYSLKSFGSSSQQLKTSDAVVEYQGVEYFVACRVKCTRRTSGYLGVFIGNNESSASVSAVTNGWVTASHIGGAPVTRDVNIYVGSAISANLDGYVDSPVAVKMDIFSTAPSSATLTALYEEYLEIVKGITTAGTETISVNENKTFNLLTEDESETFSDSICRSAFIQYMNAKALDIGMASSSFADAAGLSNSNVITAKDALHLAIHASGYNDIVKLWNKDAYTVKVKGTNARSVALETTVASSSLENHYYIFGGKTGTLSSTSNLLVLTEAPDNNWFVVACLATGTDRFSAAKQAVDAAILKYNDPTVNNSAAVVDASNVAVCLMPINNPLAYDQYTLPLLYSKSENANVVPASVTKVLTAICMLNHVTDINQRFVIMQSDVTSGSGNYFSAGDIITYRDALYAMFLPSSNTIANAVAREVGKIIKIAE